MKTLKDKIRPLMCGDGYDAEARLDKVMELVEQEHTKLKRENFGLKTTDVFSYGTNEVGDPQLYQVLQDHTSSAEWTPDTATSLYKKIGVTEEGYPEWVQPLGATDAYSKGDIVSYKGTLYRSTIDGNVWNPEDYPAGWEKYTPK